MSLYDLPTINKRKLKKKIKKIQDTKLYWGGAIFVLIFLFLGYADGIITKNQITDPFVTFVKGIKINLPKTVSFLGVEKPDLYGSAASYEQMIVNSAKDASPSVVSIIISKDVPVFEKYYVKPFGDLAPQIEVETLRPNGTEKKEVGGGSGFIISEDGLILTNKHVVSDKKADYTVYTNDGAKYPAKVLALDPVQDLAIIKIEGDQKFTAIKLGDSSSVQIGQTAIAIGNALGQFRNTISIGVISGLGRTISASDKEESFSEKLEDIIQTDAAINLGNSGGPLLNLKGEVIGINTAIAENGQGIGFAIPINRAKRDIEQVLRGGKIVYPFLGVRYALINEEIAKEKGLPVTYGAWVRKGDNGEEAVTKDGAADKAGIKVGDIILEFNNEKITEDNSMASMVMNFNSGDKVNLKVLRDKEEITVEVTLGERS